MKLFLALILFVGPLYSFSQDSCRNFRAGKFMYRDSTGNIISVTRKGNRQLEVDAKNKTKTKFRITWPAECEYHLKQIWTNDKTRRKQNFRTWSIYITKANGNDSYEYSCGCNDLPVGSHPGTMVRVSE